MTDAATPVSRDVLHQLPKADLHCHLDGSLRPATLLELARDKGVAMPRDTADALGRFMVVDDARNLEEYLRRFEITLSVMQRADAIERIAYELAADAHHDGVWYIEVRFAPLLNVREGLQTPDVVDAAVRGLARAERELGVIGRVIVTALRNLPPAQSLELARLAVAFRRRGVVGFDLAGPELGYEAARHQEAFAHARFHDMACTCHAGEGDGAGSIRQAIHVCGVHRVGHGTRLFEDPSLLEYVNDRRIPIEVCVTSNVQTRVAASYAAHPLRQYFDAGLNVVLNTDNRLMSGITLTDEYAHAATRLGFSLAELSTIAMNSFQSAFLPWPERAPLIAKARTRIAALTGGIARSGS